MSCLFIGFSVKLHPVGELVPEIGRTITMLCEITGQIPDIRPKWMKEDTAVLSLAGGGDSHLYSTYVSSSATQLTISGLVSTDAGSYICDVGPVIATFRIQVQG